MALQRPAKIVGGDYLDLKAETETGPVIAVFRITEFLPSEMDDYNKPTYPVRADALVCSGLNKGRVYLSGIYKFAITNALRGAGRDTPTPTTKVGDELVIRCERAQKKGVPTGTVFGNVPSDAEMTIAEQVYDGGAAWVTAAATPAEAPAAETGGGAKRPW